MKGLLPSCWGPPAWFFLHSTAMAYEPSSKSKQEYYNFFASLGNILPCEECKKHYTENFANSSQTLIKALETNKGLFHWVYDLHNTVNGQTGVPKSKWPSYEEVVKRYDNYRVSCDSKPGVCGVTLGEVPSKKTKVVEEFGNEEFSNDRIFSMVVSVLLLLSVGYIVYTKVGKSKKRKRKR